MHDRSTAIFCSARSLPSYFPFPSAAGRKLLSETIACVCAHVVWLSRWHPTPGTTSRRSSNAWGSVARRSAASSTKTVPFRGDTSTAGSVAAPLPAESEVSLLVPSYTTVAECPKSLTRRDGTHRGTFLLCGALKLIFRRIYTYSVH